MNRRITNLLIGLLYTFFGLSQEPVALKLDPLKVRGAEACGECHLSAFDVWKKTPHATGFKTLHRVKASEEIAKKMGFPLIKRESLCLNCHYTPTVKRDTHRALSGVSCESCHGAAADWIDVHNDYGGKGITHKTEPEAHKNQRIAASVAGGMLRPSELYGVVSNCFSCHTVPHEKLINVGGHTSGSSDFEFVTWYEKIRHNFLNSFLDGDGSVNAQRPPERKRIMYILGRSLELEYSLRGMAEATVNQRYAKAMSRRVRNAVGEMRELAGRLDSAELDGMLEKVRGVKVKPDNRPALTAAADGIGALTRTFLARADKLDLAIVDRIIDGTAPPLPAPDTIATTTPLPPESTTAKADKPTPSTQTSTPERRTITKPGVPASGAVKTKLRPASQHDAVGPSKCGNCHEGPTEWWYSDPHFGSLDRFFENEAKARKIADFYGLGPNVWLKGNRLCADCHATVLPHRKTRDARDGVGCESCHGNASAYLEAHKEGDTALGLERPGYKEGLRLGMRELRNHAVRAETCAECHYITDERLLSSGHPSGKDFDYAKSLNKIKHWEGERDGAAPAYAAALKQWGPVPSVTLARKAESVVVGGPTPTNAQTPQAKPVAESKAPGRIRTTRPTRVKAPIARPVPPQSTTKKVEVKDFPELNADTPIEDVLLLLQQRLHELYKAASKKDGTP